MDFFWVLVFLLIVLPFGLITWRLVAVRRSNVEAGHQRLVAERRRHAQAQVKRDRETLGE